MDGVVTAARCKLVTKLSRQSDSMGNISNTSHSKNELCRRGQTPKCYCYWSPKIEIPDILSGRQHVPIFTCKQKPFLCVFSISHFPPPGSHFPPSKLSSSNLPSIVHPFIFYALNRCRQHWNVQEIVCQTKWKWAVFIFIFLYRWNRLLTE